MDTKTILRDTLREAAESGKLLEVVHSNAISHREKRGDLALVLAALHNEGIIDVVTAFKGLKKNSSQEGDPNFFITRGIFEEALPHINAPIEYIMRCVSHLCTEAGQDLAAGITLSGYIEYCRRDPANPLKALKLIESEPNPLAHMMPATIIAGSQFDCHYYLTELIRLAEHADIELRRTATFSISRIQWPSESRVPENTIIALEKIVESESDDKILSGVITSSALLFQHDLTHKNRCITLIEKALVKGKDFSIHAASELLCQHDKNIPYKLLQTLLLHLPKVCLESKGTLDKIDFGIANLLRKNETDFCIQLLEALILKHPGKLRITTFDSTVHVIQKNNELMRKLITRWLLRGNRSLCDATYDIASTFHGSDILIEIDLIELKSVDFKHVYFLARKIVGYFFMKPVTATNMLVSLMRCVPDQKSLDAIGDLLRDPMLLNYTGSVYEYAKKQATEESEKVKETIEKALAWIDNYLDTLHAVPSLCALHVGQSEKEAFRRHTSELMKKSMNEAEKKSVLANLVSRSTLLYGNKVINYSYLRPRQPQRTLTPLANHSFSMEHARMSYIDPHTLDYMLRLFCLEQLRK